MPSPTGPSPVAQSKGSAREASGTNGKHGGPRDRNNNGHQGKGDTTSSSPAASHKQAGSSLQQATHELQHVGPYRLEKTLGKGQTGAQ